MSLLLFCLHTKRRQNACSIRSIFWCFLSLQRAQINKKYRKDIAKWRQIKCMCAACVCCRRALSMLILPSFAIPCYFFRLRLLQFEWQQPMNIIFFFFLLRFVLGATVASGTMWYDLVIGRNVLSMLHDKYINGEWVKWIELRYWRTVHNLLCCCIDWEQKRKMPLKQQILCVAYAKHQSTILSKLWWEFDYGQWFAEGTTNRLSSNIFDVFLVFRFLY